MKFSQNVLHYKLHTSRVYVIHIKSLSRHSQRFKDLTDKAKWRSIEASNNVNKHTGHRLLAVLNGGGSHGAVLNSTGINS